LKETGNKHSRDYQIAGSSTLR